MTYDLSRTERQHFASSRETTSTALVVTRCAYRKSSTSKQLDQHGEGVHCTWPTGSPHCSRKTWRSFAICRARRRTTRACARAFETST